MIAEVIVDITHSNVDKIFDYAVPNTLNVRVGDRVLLPFGYQKIEGFVIRLKTETNVPSGKIKSVIAVLNEIPPLTQQTIDLAGFVSTKYHALKSEVLRLMIPAKMRGDRVREVYKTFVLLNDIEYAEAHSKIKSNAKNQLALLDAVFGGEKDYTMLADSYSYTALKALIDKGIIRVEKEQVSRVPYEFMECKDIEVTLTPNQKRAVEAVHSTDKLVTLIHGVTGSGKTEIYLNLFSNCLENDKSAIMLVPEIALTPQMVGKLRGRFGDNVAILHSGLSDGERFDEWWRIRNGQARIVVGARSAIFAPLSDIGVIVIDEEHESSYVSESSPRYNTIEVAMQRAVMNGCKLVLGSATPSIESYYKATQGEYQLVEIAERVNNRVMPRFELVDMKTEIRRGNKSIISNALRCELEDCISSGNQAILFLNRRGFASHMQCDDCGYVCMCSNCDVALTYHKDEHALKCHYCGQRYIVPDKCPDCGGTHFRRSGIGTEAVVNELNKLFPNINIIRMDNDTTTTKESHSKLLGEFRSGKAQVLVGTQMVAKGHDFPSVTLVGIVNADMSLYFSDFRSGERTFQLLTQVAGRAGRAEKKGKVILQTHSPQHFIYNYVSNYDYKSFFEYECNSRQITSFPPFADIIRVMIYGEDEAKVRAVTRANYNQIKALKDKNADIFTYFNGMKSPIKRIENKFRYQIIARLEGDRESIIETLYNIVDGNKQPNVVSYLEVNPNSMF